MRKQIANSYIILTLMSAVTIGFAFIGSSQWIVSGLIITSIVFSFYILTQWLTFVRALVTKSNQALNKKEISKSKWSLHNLENLEVNQSQVLHKFQASAEVISNLTHPEKIISNPIVGADDPIGKALKNITTEMQKIKAEDEMRAWVTTGLARFSEILRKKGEVKEYSYNIISNLIKYLNANQGGIYIEYENQDSERYLELTACYAYDKRKFDEHHVMEGHGLLGQCMLEKDFIIITEVPKNYIKITSGLGESTPRSIVVAPLIFNEKFCGAIEIASFEILKPHHIEFLKHVCEDIASEIASIKTINHTQGLLNESHTLTQELQTREEEMKHNMEELAATQEEMSRKQTELTGIVNAIDSTLATAELDAHGQIIKTNTILEDFLGFSADEFRQKNYSLLVGKNNETITWNKILQGAIKSGDFSTRSKRNDEIWLSITFTPICDVFKNVTSLLCMIQNITQKKNKEKEFERLSLVANNTDNSVIITDSRGSIEYVNAGFTKMTGYEPFEVIGKKPGELLQGPLTDKKTIDKLREQISKGVSIYEEILNYNKKKQTYWVSLAINCVKNEQNEIQKFISIQSDITETKIKAMDFHQKMEALSRSNAIAEIDKEGKLIDINDNYLEILNYSRNELIGKPYSALTRKENTFHKILDTIDERGLQSGVYSRYDKKGERHYMKLMDYPVLNLKGELEKIIEFGMDVSNEKRLEKEAERRQAELNSYLSGINNTIASAEFSMDGNFINGNEIFLKVMGYSAQELANKSFEYILGDDPAVIMMWESLRLGKFFSGEFKMKNKIGKELWLTGTFNPIIIEESRPEKIMMFAQFTTQEKEKLNDLNAMVQAMKLTIPVLEFNADFQCKTANEIALKIFGLTRLELRTKHVLDFIAPHYHSTWNKNRANILTTNFTSLQLPFSCGNQVINYEASVSLTRNVDGSIGKVIMLLVKEVHEHVSILSSN